MGTALRRHRTDTRLGERIRVHAALQLTTPEGLRLAPLARCTEIGLGGIRVCAARALAPRTPVHLSLRLPGGSRVEVEGHVTWSRQTIHPALFGTPVGYEDDADFGIAFDPVTSEQLLPIARLFAARESERRRARRIRRLQGLPLPA